MFCVISDSNFLCLVPNLLFSQVSRGRSDGDDDAQVTSLPTGNSTTSGSPKSVHYSPKVSCAALTDFVQLSFDDAEFW